MLPSQGFFTFLGTGTSVGIPVIGCECPVCRSSDPRNQRTRSSLFVSYQNTQLLIDTGPDLKIQALREKLKSIDAVLYTHAHVDHVVGFDELRAFCWGRPLPLPLYGTESCLDSLKSMFPWAFRGDPSQQGYVNPDPRIIHGTFQLGEIQITPLPVFHGSVETIGYLFERENHFRFAYLPDVKTIPSSTMERLRELDILIIDALREKPHSTHLSVEESLAIIESLSPKQTYLTHISHELDHAELCSRLPERVSMAYDGLKIDLP